MLRIHHPVQKLVLFAALVLVLLVAACGPANSPAATRSGAAQTESAATGNRADLRVQVVGLLEALGPSDATVGGMRLMINEATVMDDGLAPNQVVAAESVMGDDGLSAVAIHQAQANQPASLTFELTALVESQAADAWMVGGHRVQVPATAEVTGAPQVGDLVTVQGSTDAAGALLARETRSTTAAQADGQDEIEFTGVVTAIGASEWVIGDRTVQVTAQTEVKAGVGLGVLVKVHASPQADGRLVAREIEPAPAAQPTNGPISGTPASTPAAQPTTAREQEWTGVLSAINGDLWTVGGINVRITAATEVKGTLQIGDRVKVHARPGTDGVLVAREVEPAVRDDNDDNRPGEQEFTGMLSAINGDVWTIGGVAVRVTATTEVKGTLQIGDIVKVHASAGGDGVLVAREVERAGAGDDDNSGSGNGDDNGSDDNSGPGSSDDDNGGDDNSGPGNSDDDDNDDNSGHGGGDDDNSGSGGDDNGGHGGGDDD